jgi:hypothetical protein
LNGDEERCKDDGSSSATNTAAEHSARRVQPSADIRRSLVDCSAMLLMMIVMVDSISKYLENRIYEAWLQRLETTPHHQKHAPSPHRRCRIAAREAMGRNSLPEPKGVLVSSSSL